MSVHHLPLHQVTNSRPRKTDMLAASRLISVSILAPSWSLSDQDRTNMRPASVPKIRLYPSAFGRSAVDFRRRMPPHPLIGWAHLHFDFQRGSRAFPCRVVGTIRPVLWGLNLGVEGRSPPQASVGVKGSRSEFLYMPILCLHKFTFLRNLRMSRSGIFTSIYKEDSSHERR